MLSCYSSLFIFCTFHVQQTDSKSDDSYRSKVSDIVCSILGNMCMEAAAREEVHNLL